MQFLMLLMHLLCKFNFEDQTNWFCLIESCEVRLNFTEMVYLSKLTSYQECRWLKTVHPARKRVGKLTAEEDKRMKIAVTLFGLKTWKKVARCVPGRTQAQCRERNAATIFNATEICLDEVPMLTYGSELENMHRRPVSRKGRSKRSYSTKQKTVPLSESCSSPCIDGISNGEAVRECASVDGFPRSAAICNGRRVIERGSNEGEDFVPMEKCHCFSDIPISRGVTVSTDASQI